MRAAATTDLMELLHKLKIVCLASEVKFIVNSLAENKGWPKRPTGSRSLLFYGALLQISPSPIVVLNRQWQSKWNSVQPSGPMW